MPFIGLVTIERDPTSFLSTITMLTTHIYPLNHLIQLLIQNVLDMLVFNFLAKPGMGLRKIPSERKTITTN